MIGFEFIAAAYNESSDGAPLDHDEISLIVKAKGDDALTRAFADPESEEADLWVERVIDRELRAAFDQLPKSGDSVAFDDDSYPGLYVEGGYLCSGETSTGAMIHVPIEDVHDRLLSFFKDRYNWNWIDGTGWVSEFEIDIPDGENISNNIITDGPVVGMLHIVILRYYDGSSDESNEVVGTFLIDVNPTEVTVLKKELNDLCEEYDDDDWHIVEIRPIANDEIKRMHTASGGRGVVSVDYVKQAISETLNNGYEDKYEDENASDWL